MQTQRDDVDDSREAENSRRQNSQHALNQAALKKKKKEQEDLLMAMGITPSAIPQEKLDKDITYGDYQPGSAQDLSELRVGEVTPRYIVGAIVGTVALIGIFGITTLFALSVLGGPGFIFIAGLVGIASLAGTIAMLPKLFARTEVSAGDNYSASEMRKAANDIRASIPRNSPNKEEYLAIIEQIESLQKKQESRRFKMVDFFYKMVYKIPDRGAANHEKFLALVKEATNLRQQEKFNGQNDLYPANSRLHNKIIKLLDKIDNAIENAPTQIANVKQYQAQVAAIEATLKTYRDYAKTFQDVTQIEKVPNNFSAIMTAYNQQLTQLETAAKGILGRVIHETKPVRGGPGSKPTSEPKTGMSSTPQDSLLVKSSRRKNYHNVSPHNSISPNPSGSDQN